MGLKEAVDRSRRIEPGEEHVAGQVIALLEGFALRAKKARTFTVDRKHFIGQQAQIVLAIGITDAVTQAALILGHDMRHAETGAPNLRSGIGAGFSRLRGQAGGNQRGRKANAGHGT
ncbi:hypothetical protein D3C81_1988220 [compost metagenome]